MNNQDSSQPGPDSNHALVAADTNAALPSINNIPAGLSGVHNPINDVTKGGLSPSWFYHSLRRRWLLALSSSLALASVVAGIMYYVFPETNTAQAQYKVASTQLNLIDDNRTPNKDNYQIFKNTQIASITSPYILQDALRKDISNLPMLKDEDNQVKWLQDNLIVSFPREGEILTISLSGPYSEAHLKAVVDAVSSSYHQIAIAQEKNQKSIPLEALRGAWTNLKERIRSRMSEYQSLAKDAGTSEAYAGGFDPETKFLLTEQTELLRRKTSLVNQLSEAAMQFQIFQQQINDPAYQEQLVDQALQGDPNIAQMQNEVMALDMQIRQLQSTVRGGSSAQVRRLISQRDSLNQQIALTREEMKAAYSGQNQNEPDPMLKAESTRFQIMQAMKGREIKAAEERLTEIQEELILKAENNTDLMIRLSEIEQFSALENAIASKIQSLEVELNAPDRIIGVGVTDGSQPALAETSHARNQLGRIAISSLGGLSVFGLTCFGIGYMEFLNRRLNGPDQLDEGLGIRVIGTLPGLSGRKKLNSKHPIVAQLSESIDTVRTALMHESTAKKRQVVMVTSPNTGDGRTTVASQLAASLARAGRRTLLLDGDLRHPALHTLFNLPLEDGVSEVLRAEAEVQDVIRPTEAEGLWVMTAGYCDSDATQALATDQVETIFDKLRSEFDFIIVDGAPVIGLPDALLFGQHCDGAILSVLRDHTSVPSIHSASEALKTVGIRMLGSVVNGVKCKTDSRVTHLAQVTPKSAQRQLETSDI